MNRSDKVGIGSFSGLGKVLLVSVVAVIISGCIFSGDDDADQDESAASKSSTLSTIIAATKAAGGEFNQNAPGSAGSGGASSRPARLHAPPVAAVAVVDQDLARKLLWVHLSRCITFNAVDIEAVQVNDEMYVRASEQSQHDTGLWKVLSTGTEIEPYDDLAKAWSILKASMFYHIRSPKILATQLMDVAVLAKQKGVLALSQQEDELNKDPYIAFAMRYITDGFKTEDVLQILTHDMDSLIDRHKTGASIIRRASEVAPAMGLIGTLVGLVQMLSQLNDPSSIGPAMAVALLTTFYGAILGTVILAPMAAKLAARFIFQSSHHRAPISCGFLPTTIGFKNSINPGALCFGRLKKALPSIPSSVSTVTTLSSFLPPARMCFNPTCH